jgi:Sigma-70 region 3
MPLRPELQAVFDALLKAHPDGPTLDDLSDETWNKSLSYADIDELIAALEEAGFDLEAAEPPPRPEELAQVLAAARALTGETGKRPSVDEIAARAGLPASSVLRALRMGRAFGAAKEPTP